MRKKNGNLLLLQLSEREDMTMQIGKERNSLKLNDKVLLRMEQNVGVGEIVRIEFFKSQDKELYYCTFKNRSDGYFERKDLHCDRLDGKTVYATLDDDED